MTKAVLGSIITVAIFACGCALGSSRHAAPLSSGFQPRQEYLVEYEKMWTTVQRLLDEERVGVASSDKQAGRIATDYIQGETQFQVIMSVTTRYKYSIQIEAVAQGRCRVRVVATLESMSARIPWHDISRDNAQIVRNLEYSFYEKLEKKL